MSINFNAIKNSSSEAGNLVQKLPTTQDVLQKYTQNIFKVRENFGIEGFNFSILQSISSNLETEFTEHYLENGAFVSDHSVDKPITLEMTGIITEVVLRPSVLQNGLSSVSKQLGIVSTYAPSLTQGATQQLSKITQQVTQATNYVDGLINNAKSFMSFLSDLKPNISNQQKAIESLDAVRKARKLLTIENYTGTMAYQNMVITGISPQIQLDRDGKEMTTLKLSFKEIRFGNIETRAGTKTEVSLGRTFGMKSAFQAKQNQQGVSTTRNISFLKSLFS